MLQYLSSLLTKIFIETKFAVLCLPLHHATFFACHLLPTQLTRSKNVAWCRFFIGTFFFLIYLFYLFYFWLCWVFIAVRGLSLVPASSGYSSLWCTGFSMRWLLLLQSTGSRCTGFSSCGSWAPERRLSSCGAQA